MFISFIIAKNGKEPSCPSTGDKLWSIHASEYCSTGKRNELLTRATSWTISRELHWVQKANFKSYILYSSIYVTFSKCCNYRDGKQISGCQVWRLWGEEGVATKGRRDGTAPHLHCGGGGCAKVRGIKSPWTIVCRCTCEHTHTRTCIGEYVHPGEIWTSSVDCRMPVSWCCYCPVGLWMLTLGKERWRVLETCLYLFFFLCNFLWISNYFKIKRF